MNAPLSDDELRITYQLSRHVPDMERGFTITTNYGGMRVEGPLAKRFAATVREALLNDLALANKAQATNPFGFHPDAVPFKGALKP